MVSNLKRYFTAQFISGAVGVFNTPRYDYSYRVFPNDLRLDTKNTYRNRWTPNASNEIGIPPLRKKIPQGAKNALNKIFDGFSSLYDKIYTISPEYLEYATDVYCAFIEFYYLEMSGEKMDMHADLSYAIFDKSRDSFIVMINSMNVRKEKSSMKVNYYGEQQFNSFSSKKEFATYTDKFRAMSQENLDSYMEDFLEKKRGMIAGKKFGL